MLKRTFILMICLLMCSEASAQLDSMRLMQSLKPGLGVSASFKASNYFFDAGLWIMNDKKVYGMVKYSTRFPILISGDVSYKAYYHNLRPGIVFAIRKHKRTLLVNSLHADLRRVRHEVSQKRYDPFLEREREVLYASDVTYDVGVSYEFNALTVFRHFFLNYGISTGLLLYQPTGFVEESNIKISDFSPQYPLHLHVFFGAGFYIDQ